jgi:hypothetical protein
MKSLTEYASGLSTGLDENVDVADKVIFVLVGNLYARNLSELNEQAMALRRTFKLLPLAMGKADCDVVWGVSYKVVGDETVSSEPKYEGKLAFSDLYDSDFKLVPSDIKLLEKAFYGTWPLSLVELRKAEGDICNLNKLLELKENDEGEIVMISDNIYKYAALKAKRAKDGAKGAK